GFRTGADHAHHFNTRYRCNDQFCQLRFRFRGRAETGPAVQGFFNHPHHARMAVAQDERAPGADIVQIAVAVQVVEIRPFATGDEDGLTADAAEGPRGAVDTAGDELA